MGAAKSHKTRTFAKVLWTELLCDISLEIQDPFTNLETMQYCALESLHGISPIYESELPDLVNLVAAYESCK
jgi:hypothetical protein